MILKRMNTTAPVFFVRVALTPTTYFTEYFSGGDMQQQLHGPVRRIDELRAQFRAESSEWAAARKAQAARDKQEKTRIIGLMKDKIEALLSLYPTWTRYWPDDKAHDTITTMRAVVGVTDVIEPGQEYSPALNPLFDEAAHLAFAKDTGVIEGKSQNTGKNREWLFTMQLFETDTERLTRLRKALYDEAVPLAMTAEDVDWYAKRMKCFIPPSYKGTAAEFAAEVAVPWVNTYRNLDCYDD